MSLPFRTTPARELLPPDPLQPAPPAPPVIESTEDLKKSVLETQKPAAPAPDPRDEREWVFQFSWTDGRGRDFKGQFRNKVLSIAEQQSVAMLRARYQGGLSFESIDPAMREVNRACAHMEFSLMERPTWAQDLRAIIDPNLILRLWEEVASHEVRFLGLDQNS